MAKTGVVEFTFCKLCRVHHNAGRKHIFTKKHKGRLATVLSKFRAKIKDARRCLKKPVVEEGEVEPEIKIWCYCCDEEVDKHVTDREMSVVQGGVLEHMASSDHHKKTRHFWWQHGADVSDQPHFLLHQLDYERYKEAVSVAVKAVEARVADRQEKEVAALRTQETQRAALFHSQSFSGSYPQCSWDAAAQSAGSEWPNSHHQHNSSKTASSSATPPHVPSTRTTPTAATQLTPHTATIAYPDSLTSIHRRGGGRLKGNVHTGAVPPWLRDDDDEMPLIGPSEEAFQNYLATKKRGGKNPKRVGAEFMQKMKRVKEDDDDDSWLPSFGRVWNHGPRLHSKLEFMTESGRERDKKRKHVDGMHFDAMKDVAEKQACTSPSPQNSIGQQTHPETVDRSHSGSFHSTPHFICPIPLQTLPVSSQSCLSTLPPVDVRISKDACSSWHLPNTRRTTEESKETRPSQTVLSDSRALSALSETLTKHRLDLLKSLNRKKGNST